MTSAARRAISFKHIATVKRMEKRFVKPIADAIAAQIKPVAEAIRHNGVTDATTIIDKMLVNDAIEKPIREMYSLFGAYGAYKTRAEINKSIRAKRETKAFGINEELLKAILAYLEQFIFSRVIIPITETTRKLIYKKLTEGIAKGWGAAKIADELERPDMPQWRALMIVRTESLKAMQYGRQTAQRVSRWETVSEWIAANDHRTRHSHRDVDGEQVAEGKRFAVPIYKGKLHIGVDMMIGPGDPHASAGNVINCFPADTLVEGQFVGAQRLKYSGQLIEIITRSGKRLSVTPNHPIFTNKGTIPANRIAKGDYVFSNVKEGKDVFRLVNDYVKKKPILAKDFFRTLQSLCTSKRMMIGALDFNGDSAFGDGNVDIVNMNGELQFNLHSAPEDIGKFSFKPTHLERFFVSCFCALNKLSLTSGLPSNRSMRSDDLPLSGGLTHLRPFQYLSIGASTNWNASRFESFHQGDANDAAFISKLLHGNAGIISKDEVVEIRNRNFSGHVYDFSTLSGAILANNIYISNCRCTLATVAKRDENGNLIPKRNISVILPGGFVNTSPVITI